MSESTKDHDPATALQALRTVLWSFLGIRSKEGHQADISRLSMTKIIVFGIFGAALFVMGLLILVYFVTR
ncbi:MAG: DUF2970 domain-containing protein [Gallionellaceae bacterium]|jgi:hypothetical protein